jgi:hypothetical protein
MGTFQMGGLNPMLGIPGMMAGVVSSAAQFH